MRKAQFTVSHLQDHKLKDIFLREFLHKEKYFN